MFIVINVIIQRLNVLFIFFDKKFKKYIDLNKTASYYNIC